MFEETRGSLFNQLAKFCFWSSAFTGRPLSTSTLDAAFGVTSIWPSNWPTFRNDPVLRTKFEHQLVLLICSKSSWNISIKHPFFIIIDKSIKSIYFDLTITLFLFMPDQLNWSTITITSKVFSHWASYLGRAHIWHSMKFAH